MRRLLTPILFIIVSSFACENMFAQVNWASFLRAHDMEWKRFPGHWDECLFIGNGTLGAALYRDKKNQPAWHINRTDHVVQDSRYPVGSISLVLPADEKGADARLDLWNAEGTGTIRYGQGELKWKTFISTDYDVLVIDCETSDKRKPQWIWMAAVPIPPIKEIRKLPLDSSEQHPPSRSETAGDITTEIQVYRTGEVYVSARTVLQIAPGKYRLLVALKTGRSLNEVSKAATDAIHVASRVSSTLESLHQKWWHAYYPESFLSIPDKRLEAFYWIQVYKIGSAMRPDSKPLDLMGPWFYRTRWPRIWWNLNIQMTYYPLFTANRMAFSESLFRTLDEHSDALMANAAQFHDSAAVIGRSSSYDLVSPVDLETTTGAHEPGNLLWTLHLYWLYYRNTMDKKILERLVPHLERAIRFHLHYLYTGPDGKLHFPPTVSPEYNNVKNPVADATYELALLRWSGQTLLDCYKQMGITRPLAAKVKEALAKLTDYPAGKNGWDIGRDMPLENSHRHHSHLFPYYPLLLFNWDQEENRQVIAASVNHWLSKPELFVGFSYPVAASMLAHMGDGNRATPYLHRLLSTFTNPNTLYEEGVDALPTIETPLAVNTTLQEMLLQSWGGKLRIFPALPSGWKDAAFSRFAAEGGFVVSAIRKNGKTVRIEIESKAGEELVLLTDLPWPWKISAVRKPAITKRQDGAYTISLRAGEKVVLSSPNAKVEELPAPVAGKPAARFGQGDAMKQSALQRTPKMP
ncbi:MAG: glycoside hydrolase family 95-like protein [Bacteroidota bacterium]